MKLPISLQNTDVAPRPNTPTKYADDTFTDCKTFARHLRNLKLERNRRVRLQKETRANRNAPNKEARAYVLLKSGGRCHICGGTINGDDWQADHVFAHSAGGTGSLDNYLAAHSLCNNYRWHYDTEEFQWILKLGVWLRTQIEFQTPIGIAAGTKFVHHDRRRSHRRKHIQRATLATVVKLRSSARRDIL